MKLDKLFEVVSQGALSSPIFQMMAVGAIAGDLTRIKFSIANAARERDPDRPALSQSFSNASAPSHSAASGVTRKRSIISR